MGIGSHWLLTARDCVVGSDRRDQAWPNSGPTSQRGAETHSHFHSFFHELTLARLNASWQIRTNKLNILQNLSSYIWLKLLNETVYFLPIGHEMQSKPFCFTLMMAVCGWSERGHLESFREITRPNRETQLLEASGNLSSACIILKAWRFHSKIYKIYICKLKKKRNL